jgi:Uma2 family endonuclease
MAVMNEMSAIRQVFAGTQAYRMTAAAYLRTIDAGSFGDAHVELVEGELIEMAPSGLDHGRANVTIPGRLAAVYDLLGYPIYVDVILKLSEATVRAPDIAVVDKDTGQRQHLVPSDVLLAIEIAGSTLTEDIGRKRVDYASAGIRNYWVVDIEGRRVHCYADPQGSDYAAIQVIAFGDPVPVPGTAETITVA